jgi:hypothetical protein
LNQQEAYFVYVDHFLGWINYEGRFRAKMLTVNPLGPKPSAPRRPALKQS